MSIKTFCILLLICAVASEIVVQQQKIDRLTLERDRLIAALTDNCTAYCDYQPDEY